MVGRGGGAPSSSSGSSGSSSRRSGRRSSRNNVNDNASDYGSRVAVAAARVAQAAGIRNQTTSSLHCSSFPFSGLTSFVICVGSHKVTPTRNYNGDYRQSVETAGIPKALEPGLRESSGLKDVI